MKNRIFFVTSPLQILNTKSAIDNLGRDIYKDYVIIIHSSLTNFLKKIVQYYAKKYMLKEIIYIIFIFNNGCLRSIY